jgi:hypothetical protein
MGDGPQASGIGEPANRQEFCGWIEIAEFLQ